MSSFLFCLFYFVWRSFTSSFSYFLLLLLFFSVRFLPLPCAVGIACMATCQFSLFLSFFLFTILSFLS
jgi:hypothetical protein